MVAFVDDVSALSDDELLSYSVKLAQHEKEIGLQIIACLREAERRMLYCQLGMSSLWEYATLHLGLSSGNAQMKIDAMRLSRDNPVAQEKIATGELSLVNAAKVNSFFRQEKRSGHVYSPEQKAEVIESVLGLSQSKCERVLLARSPESIPAERIRPLTETKTELKIVVTHETMTILERLKDLLSNKMPNATYADLLESLAREKIDLLERKQMGATLSELELSVPKSPEIGKVGQILAHVVQPSGVLDVAMRGHEDRPGSEGPVAKMSRQGLNPSLLDASVLADTTPVEVRTEIRKIAAASYSGPTPRKYISVEDRRWVMRRAKGQCEHVGSNGRRCSNKRHLHLDHVVPLALGGQNERSNYRIVCRSCNLFYAKVHLGDDLMRKYIVGLN